MEHHEILAKIEKVLGHQNSQAWLHQPNIALNGKTPAEYIHTPKGIKEIERILSAIEHGGVV